MGIELSQSDREFAARVLEISAEGSDEESAALAIITAELAFIKDRQAKLHATDLDAERMKSLDLLEKLMRLREQAQAPFARSAAPAPEDASAA